MASYQENKLSKVCLFQSLLRAYLHLLSILHLQFLIILFTLQRKKTLLTLRCPWGWSVVWKWFRAWCMSTKMKKPWRITPLWSFRISSPRLSWPIRTSCMPWSVMDPCEWHSLFCLKISYNWIFFGERYFLQNFGYHLKCKNVCLI